jgi:hypothetical protein
MLADVNLPRMLYFFRWERRLSSAKAGDSSHDDLGCKPFPQSFFIWQVFEDQGTNKYATWVWEMYCLEPERKVRESYNNSLDLL